VHNVVFVTPYPVCDAGAVPTTQVPHLGAANALVAKTAGNANAEAKAMAFMIFFMVTPKVISNKLAFAGALNFIRAMTQ
jgi:hypothetical protein